MKKIINMFKFLRKNGLHGFIKECYYRLIDNYYEMYFHVETEGYILKEDLGITHDESLDYGSLSYRHIINVLKKLPVEKNKSTLLDYGCGKGRVIIAAAGFQYKKIIGLELSELISVAKNNINRMKHRKTKNVIFEHCDAADFKVPSDVNIIYFFNPFVGSLLEKVVMNIYSSYKETPRKTYIIYFNNDHFDKVIANQAWITKTYQSEFHLNLSCGIYETTS